MNGAQVRLPVGPAADTPQTDPRTSFVATVAAPNLGTADPAPNRPVDEKKGLTALAPWSAEEEAVSGGVGTWLALSVVVMEVVVRRVLRMDVSEGLPPSNLRAVRFESLCEKYESKIQIHEGARRWGRGRREYSGFDFI